MPCQSPKTSSDVSESPQIETSRTLEGALKNRKHWNSNLGLGDKTSTSKGGNAKNSVWKTKHSIIKDPKLTRRSKLDLKRSASGCAMPLKTRNSNHPKCREARIHDGAIATLLSSQLDQSPSFEEESPASVELVCDETFV